MRATIDRVDVVGERIYLLVVTIVVLNGHFDRERVSNLLKIDWLVVQDAAALVQVFDELSDTATIVKLVRLLSLFALIFDRDPNSFVEKSFFAQALRKFFKTEFRSVEDFGVRLEGNLGAAFTSLAGLLQALNRNSAHIVLFVSQSIAPDFQMQLFRKKVNAGHPDAVQSAGDFVSIRIELTACMQFGHHNLSRRTLFFLHHIDGNTAAVIDYRNRVIEMDRYFNCVAVSGQCFVN